jgi:hypothetical protein
LCREDVAKACVPNDGWDGRKCLLDSFCVSDHAGFERKPTEHNQRRN